MQDLKTGWFNPLEPDEANVLRRIFEAGNRELPIFEVGEIIEIRNGRFEVLALSGDLFVLRGLPRQNPT